MESRFFRHIVRPEPEIHGGRAHVCLLGRESSSCNSSESPLPSFGDPTDVSKLVLVHLKVLAVTALAFASPSQEALKFLQP